MMAGTPTYGKNHGGNADGNHLHDGVQDVVPGYA